MATDLKAAPKHELFVEQQLDRVSKRLHALDLGRLALLLVAAIMTQALAMALIDLAAGPKAGGWVTVVRLAVWGLFLAGTLAVGGWLLYRVFSKINPYFAARQIEDTIPDAKNSVVNWLDLRDEPLAPVIKNTLGLRAAKDLKSTDPDHSLHARKNTWLLALVVGVLLLGLVVILIREPGRFGSLMRRAFIPVGDFTLGTRTRITLLEPAKGKGDVTVKPQEPVTFEVKLSGAVPRINTPEEARVLYRNGADQSWVKLVLEESEGVWSATMESDRVQNGFVYKIVAGDAETPEYQVTVQSLPGYAATPARWFEIDYVYPAYTHIPDLKVTSDNEVYPRISGPAGTQVSLLIRTNRDLHSGKIELEFPGGVRKEVAGALVPNDPRAFRSKFNLETSGQFRVRFTTSAGDENGDNTAYQLVVSPDNAPSVELRKPGKDIELPADGTLQLEGYVSDDYGIKNVVLRLEVQRRSIKTPLAEKVYRPDKSFRFEDGTYADRLEYRDFVVLSQLKDRINEDAGLAKGDVLHYWLEATDNCDYPAGKANVGHSKSYKVTITDGKPDSQENKKQREQQQQAQREHEKRQDEDLKKQEHDRQQKRQKDQNGAGGKDAAGNDAGGNNAAAEQKRDELFKQAKDLLDKNKQAQGEKPGAGNQKKGWSEKDVEDLKKLAEEDKGPAGDWARQQLKEASEKAGNSNVREAAQKSTEDQQPADKQSQDKLKELAQNKDAVGDAAAQELARQAQQGKDQATRDAAAKALKEAGREDMKPAPGKPDGNTQNKDWSEKDLEKLNKMLKDKGPVGDWARQQLKEASEKAKNEAIRKAADKSIQQQDGQLSKESMDKLKDLAQNKDAVGNAAAQELAKQAQQGKDQATRDAAAKALKEAGREDAKPPLKPDGPNNPQAPKQDWSEKDLEKLDKILKDKGPIGDWARQQMKEASEKAKDDAVRKAAEKTLQEQKNQKGGLSKETMDKLKDLAQNKDAVGNAAAQELAKQAQQGKDQATRDAAAKALKDAGREDALQPPGKPDGGQATPGNPQGQKQEWTDKDIDKLSKLAADKGPVGQWARDQIKEASEKAKNKDVRDAAQKSLQQGQEGLSKESMDKLKDLAGKKDAVGDAAAQELARQAKEGKDQATRDAAAKALKEAGREDALRPAGAGNQADSTRVADPLKHVTLKEIDDLKKLQKKQGWLGDNAKRDLAEAARLADNPKVREAAKDALDNPPPQTEEPNRADVANLKELSKEKGQQGAGAQRELARLSTQAKNKDVRDDAARALKELGTETAGQDPIRDATTKDVKQLEKKINKEGLLGDATAQALAEIARNARDEAARKAADETLKKRDPAKTEPVTPQEVEEMSQALDDRGPGGEAMAREMARLIHDSKNPQVRDAALSALERANIDRKTLQRKENLTPSPADLEASKRGGSLNLSELKKLPPEILKQLGKTQAQWDDMIRAAKEKEDSTRLGNPSQLPSTAPHLVDPKGNASSLQGNQGQPPPGWGGVVDRYTAPRTNPDGK